MEGHPAFRSTHVRTPKSVLFRVLVLAAMAAVILAVQRDSSVGQQPVGQVQLAQFPFFRGRVTRADRSQPVDGVFLPVDRETALRLDRAKEMLGKGQTADAVLELDGILDRREDFFFKPDPKETIHRSLKAEAQRLLGSLDKEQRAVYELQFGVKARQLLDEATRSGKLDQLTEVVRRFFHTDAGYEAALVLAQHYSDHNQPLAAALVLARVKNAPVAAEKYDPNLSLMLAACWLRAGMNEKAQTELAAIKQAYPQARFDLAGKRFEIGEPAAALSALAANLSAAESKSAAVAHWALPGGNAARNAAMSGGSPLLNERWSASVFYSNSLLKGVTKLRKQYIDSGRPVIPSAQPLAVGNLVLMRTPNVVYAVDFETGKLLWPWPAQQAGDEQVNAGRDPSYLQMISERVWDNNTYGSMSSDGELLFVVHEDDLQEAMVQTPRPRTPRAVVMTNGQVIQGATYNVLSAHSLPREGAIEWYVGGMESEMEPELAGAFFLGPPLPLQGDLYALAEIKGGINLVVLDAKTGKLEWMQQLAIVEQTLQLDPLRRQSGVSPSFADGVLVCPTSAGAAVAVDLATRSLVWGYQYPRSAEQDRMMQQRMAMGWNFNGNVAMPVNPGSHWADSNALIADGRVFVTAVESDQLHCLSLLEGKELWTKKRDDGLYVATVAFDRVVIVREQQVEAVSAADHKTLWTATLGASRPSGRGFRSGQYYYLPLSTAEVVKIDLATGEIKARSRSRTGAIPGNLICYKGYVISQGVDTVDKYFQLEPLRKQVEEMLAKDSNDPEALAWRGEIALDDGDLGRAVDDLRKSYAFHPAADAKTEYLNRLEAEHLRTRGLLIDALTAVLRDDFPTHKSALPELKALIETDEERAGYLRVLAAGLQIEGNNAEALAAYLKLADLKTSSEELEDVEVGRTVRRDRWIGAQLARLWKSTAEGDRTVINEAVATRLEAAKDNSTASNSNGTRADRLRAFLATFSFHPLADTAREELLGQLGEAESGLEREQLLMRLEKSSEPARAAAAVARLATLYQSAGRHRDSAIYYRKLKEDFAKVDCLDGKTGAELVAQLPADDKIRRAMELADSWPAGAVKEAERRNRPPTRNQGYQQYWNVEMRGESEPFFAGRSLQFDQSMSQLVGRDEFGREMFRLLLNETAQFRNYFYGANTNYAVADGHLLVVNTGFQVLAINTLNSNNRARPVLWHEDLIDAVQLQMQQMMGVGGFNSTPDNNPWGQRRRGTWTVANQPAADISSVIDGGVAIVRGRELSFLDALTGRPLWVRQNIPADSDVYGDSEVLIVAPGNNPTGGGSATASGEALVLRTRDGELLGKCKAPSVDRRWTTYGRNLLTWYDVGSKRRLVVRDVWADKEIELGVYPSSSKGTIVEGDSVAVYDSSGRFVVHSLADGRKLLEAAVEPDDKLHNIFVQRTGSQYLLTSNRPRLVRTSARADTYQPAMADPFQDGFNQGLVCGRVYAFDRQTGQSQWQIPALIDMHGYVITQGSELPVLTFVRHVQQRNQMKVSLLCLDKRTGRAVYQNDEVNGQAPSFEASADPDEKTVTLQIPGQSIVLNFTDAPVAPEPPYQAGIEPPAAAAASSKVGWIFRILGEAGDQIERASEADEAPPVDTKQEVPTPAEQRR